MENLKLKVFYDFQINKKIIKENDIFLIRIPYSSDLVDWSKTSLEKNNISGFSFTEKGKDNTAASFKTGSIPDPEKINFWSLFLLNLKFHNPVSRWIMKSYYKIFRNIASNLVLNSKGFLYWVLWQLFSLSMIRYINYDNEGMGFHADGNAFTLIAEDDSGIVVHTKKGYRKVIIPRGCLLFLKGMQWSKEPPIHKVVTSKRKSLVFFTGWWTIPFSMIRAKRYVKRFKKSNPYP